MRTTAGRRAASWRGCCVDMEISIAEQAAAFAGAILLGFAIGVFYDLLRLFRVRLPIPFLGSVLDLLFWGAVVTSLFLYVTGATGGQMRIYVLLSVFGGAVVYFLTLSAWILSFGNLIADAIAFLGRLMKLPFRFLHFCGKKFEKNLKNLFLYRRKWFRIEAAFEAMEDAARFGTARKEEGECHASDQSKSAD